MSPIKPVEYKDIYDLGTLNTAWDQIRRRGGPDEIVIDVTENVDYEFYLKRNLGILSS